MLYLPDNAYSNYYNKSLIKRWFTPNDLKSAIGKLNLSGFKKHQVSTSFLGKPIYGYSFGTGAKRVLVWSQMHGNEPTATHALLEVFDFLTSAQHKSIIDLLKSELSICFIPMLNPDGAATFTRQNAQGIDMNRDAVKPQTPEMQSFFKFVSLWKPHWAFNLHDQRNIFNCGGSPRPATISFLAPSANQQRQATEVQRQCIGLIDSLLHFIQPIGKDCIARFTDEYYPKALGEYFMRNEVPCMLIECGAAYNDPLRLTARKLTFLSLIHSFCLLAQQIEFNTDDRYFDLPLNAQNNVDILFIDTRVDTPDGDYKTDLALLLKEELNANTGMLEQKYTIHEIGNLSHKHGLATHKGAQICMKGNPIIESYANFEVELTEGKMRFEKGILLQ